MSCVKWMYVMVFFLSVAISFPRQPTHYFASFPHRHNISFHHNHHQWWSNIIYCLYVCDLFPTYNFFTFSWIQIYGSYGRELLLLCLLSLLWLSAWFHFFLLSLSFRRATAAAASETATSDIYYTSRSHFELFSLLSCLFGQTFQWFFAAVFA